MPNENREVLVYEVSLNHYLETLSAKLDNFKDEKIKLNKNLLENLLA